MSDEYDYAEMDREVSRNMAGQTFIVTIRNRPDTITPDDLRTEITYNENDVEAADCHVEAIQVLKRGLAPNRGERGEQLVFYVEDAA